MMKEEFEKLAGYEVSNEDYYNIIEKMYMAVDLTKAEFVKTIDKKRFALKPVKVIIKEMRQAAEQLKESCDHYIDFETSDKLEKLIREYISRKGWEGYAGFMLNTKQTPGHCYFPYSVSIYGFMNYRNIEEIQLTA